MNKKKALKDQITKVIEDLRHNTTTRNDQLNYESAPSFGILTLEPKFSYKYNNKEYIIRDKSFQCYLAIDLPFVHPANDKIIYMENMVNCIIKKYIYPFMLFIQGEFIPWSNITVVKDYSYTYLLISGVDDFDTFDDYSSIYCPCGVKYGESNLMFPASSNPSFLFDSNGKLTSNTNGLIGRVEIIDKNVIGHRIKLEYDKGYFAIPCDEMEIAQFQIIFFKNGSPFESAMNYIYHRGANIYEFDKDELFDSEDDSIIAMVYYNKTRKSNSTIYATDILDLNEVKTEIIREIVENDTESFDALLMENIVEEFDFDFYVENTYEENVDYAFEYINSYNPNYIIDGLKDYDKLYETKTYTGREVNSFRNDEKYITMFRRNDYEALDTYVLMLVNGKLFKHYDTIEYHTNKFKIFIGDEILDDDVIEFLFYTRVNNQPVETEIDKVNKTISLSPIYAPEDILLYSKEVSDPLFNLYSEKDHLQYKVGFEFTEVNDDLVCKLELEDEFYYNRKLTCISQRQFRYCRNYISMDSVTLTLSPDFKYCHNLSHYMVFVNGSKLSRLDLYTISTPANELPFDELCIYTNTIIPKGSYVDIFYLPEVLNEETYMIEELVKK